MLSLFKNLFGKPPAEPTPPSTPVQVAPAAPVSAPTRTAAPAPAPPAEVESGPREGMVVLSLRTIIEKLPAPFKGRVRNLPARELTFALPLKSVIEQLARGAVKVPLSQLRAAAPPETFDSNPDDALVPLPLQHVLSQINPAQLPRRADQKRVETPQGIRPIFGPDGKAPFTETPEPPPPAVTEQPLASAPAPVAPVPESALIQPIAPLPPPASAAPPVPAETPAFKPPPVSAPEPAAPIKPLAPLPRPQDLAPATPAPPVAPVAPPAPLTPVSPPTFILRPGGQPATAGETGFDPDSVVTLRLAELTANWPGELKTALALHLGQVVVNIPILDLDPLMQRGKVAFTWKRIRTWTSPPLAADLAAEHNDEWLELPLRAIIPKFLERRQRTARRQVEVSESIPDLFAAREPVLAPAPPAPSVPETPIEEPTPVPAPAPAPAPIPAPVQAPAAAPVSATSALGEIFGQPDKAKWTPDEIVEHTARLGGVAGVLIGTEDGLPVASQWPAEFNGPAMAGFMPGIFARTGQYTRELRLGEPDSVTFLFAGRPLALHRAGEWFFATLGKAGEELPVRQLGVVAEHLAKNYS